VANQLFVAKQFTLGKEERLKSRKQTELLFSEGKKFTIAPFRFHYLFSNAEKTSLQFGAGVSKRNFKKAVDRNRIKRLMREAYRLQKIILQEKLKEQNSQISIFFIYTGKELPEYKEVFVKIGKGLDKLYVLLSEYK
jgi:ribonuclease P protein component